MNKELEDLRRNANAFTESIDKLSEKIDKTEKQIKDLLKDFKEMHEILK